MLAWTGFTFPVTYFIYFLLILDPYLLVSEENNNLYALIFLRGAISSTFGLNLFSILFLGWNFHYDLSILYLIHWLMMPMWAMFGVFVMFNVPLLTVVNVYLYYFQGASLDNIHRSQWVSTKWQEWVRDSGLYGNWGQSDEGDPTDWV